jgi:hypothetical protein
LSFLDKFRKTEDKDPLHKWSGTYNLKREILRQFFTWLNDPFTERNRRSRPKIMENIPQFKRKEVSIYKPSDLLTQQDDLLFLSYCPSKRDRCYHTLSRDSSCRPHELLKLRTKSSCSPYLPENVARFTLSQQGVSDAMPYDECEDSE